MRDLQQLSPSGSINNKIYHIRGMKVMFDCDLAELFRVTTHDLRQAVERNRSKFPEDFMIVVTESDFTNWNSQPVSSLNDTMSLNSALIAFTGQGVAMLSTVINSKRAIEVNIQIIRSVGKMRHMISKNADLAKSLKTLSRKHDSQFRDVFVAIHALMEEPEHPKHKIVFTAKEKRLAHDVYLMG
jgi:hypothetical protein